MNIGASAGSRRPGGWSVEVRRPAGAGPHAPNVPRHPWRRSRRIVAGEPERGRAAVPEGCPDRPEGPRGPFSDPTRLDGQTLRLERVGLVAHRRGAPRAVHADGEIEIRMAELRLDPLELTAALEADAGGRGGG